MSVQFFQTMMGRAFYEGDVKDIKKSLSNIATSLDTANQLKKQELLLLCRINNISSNTTFTK